MLCKGIRFLFQEPISEAQENILARDFISIREAVRKEMSKMLKTGNMLKIINPTLGKALEARGQATLLLLNTFITSDKVSDKEYYFYFPADYSVLFKIKDLGELVGLKQLRGREFALAGMLQEKRLIQGFKDITLKNMKVDLNTVKVELTESKELHVEEEKKKIEADPVIAIPKPEPVEETKVEVPVPEKIPDAPEPKKEGEVKV